MGRIEGDGIQRRVVHQPQPKVEPKIKPEERAGNNSRATRIGDLQLQGQQKRDRIERLYGASAASVSMMNDISLIRATAKADNAHLQTFYQETFFGNCR